MIKNQVDGVIETVRYDENGRISLIRVYERRGPTYSDLILLSRDQLVEKLRNNKKFYVGKRIRLLASTFELASPVFLSRQAGMEFITDRQGPVTCDSLPDAPSF